MAGCNHNIHDNALDWKGINDFRFKMPTNPAQVEQSATKAGGSEASSSGSDIRPMFLQTLQSSDDRLLI